MANESSTPLTFAYRAQTREGQPITGSIEAENLASANQRLQSLQLTVVEIEPAGRPPRPHALRGEDFAAFNQQLAQLTGAGLPVEQGLRLIAAEMGRGSMRRTLELVASDLESGKTLPQAIEAHRGEFPPLYASLVEAGIRANNLPGILLNLGRHLTLVRRLQAMLWRTFSYPIMVLAVFLVVTFFMLTRVMPQFQGIFKGYSTELPGITTFVMSLSRLATESQIWVIATGVTIVGLLSIALWMTSRERSVAERLLLAIPLIGPILRRNLISRWCDAVGLGVDAGMDLPAAIAMADDAIGSSGLRADGQAIVGALGSGQPIAQIHQGRILLPMVISAMDLAATRNDLPRGLSTLSQLYQQQAQMRMDGVDVILTPLVIILLGLLVGTMILAMFAPIISLINAISGPHF